MTNLTTILLALLSTASPAPAAGPRASAGPSGEERAALLAFLRAHAGRADRAVGTEVSIAKVALRPGPERQFIVYLAGPAWCGSGGCVTMVVERGPGGFREVTSINISRPPILVLESSSKGWRDVAVWVSGGGIQPGYQALLPFDGITYAGNPSVPPARPLPASVIGHVVIDREARGQPLFAGPSFDCALASTRIEKALCTTPALADLDLKLADTYRATLEASSADRTPLQDSQIAWLRHRDVTCRDGKARCLHWLYRDRLAELGEPQTRLALSLCSAVAARARSATSEPRVDPVPLARPIPGPDALTLAGWDAWGRRQEPAFTFEVSPLSDEPFQNDAKIQQVPGAQWYMAALTMGTAHCYRMAFFRNQNGRAVRVKGPPAWETGEDGSGCGTLRGFGSVDGVPVAVEKSSSPYDLEERMTLARWDGEEFGAPCELRFAYQPTFGPPSSSQFPEDCGADGCGPLREVAAGVVAEAYAAGAQPVVGPLHRKRTIDGVAYSVSASRATMGWRVFSAWEVTFQRADGKGEPRKVVVDVGRGPLREVRVW